MTENLSGLTGNSEDKVYEIRAGDQHWAAVGSEVTATPRFGLPAPHLPREWLNVTVDVTGAHPQEIPEQGLSLYDEVGRPIGEKGAWRCASCIRVDGLRILKLTTRDKDQ
jgi:hypothetical protein